MALMRGLDTAPPIHTTTPISTVPGAGRIHTTMLRIIGFPVHGMDRDIIRDRMALGHSAGISGRLGILAALGVADPL